LRPLAEKDYREGAQGIVTTLARSSYILRGDDVLWCVEWRPGLVVIEFSPAGRVRWCAPRSPDPQFGGRQGSGEEVDAYDDEAPNPQYGIVFTAWDAQDDPGDRQGWKPASKADQERHTRAMTHANHIGAETAALSREAQMALLERCKASDIYRGAIV